MSEVLEGIREGKPDGSYSQVEKRDSSIGKPNHASEKRDQPVEKSDRSRDNLSAASRGIAAEIKSLLGAPTTPQFEIPGEISDEQKIKLIEAVLQRLEVPAQVKA